MTMVTISYQRAMQSNIVRRGSSISARKLDRLINGSQDIFVTDEILENDSTGESDINFSSNVLPYELKIKLAYAYAFGCIAIVLFLACILLSIGNVIHYAVWLPALPVLVGVMMAMGAQINRIKGWGTE